MIVHYELYRLQEDDYPVYIELIHNTDDDTLLLLFVAD